MNAEAETNTAGCPTVRAEQQGGTLFVHVGGTWSLRGSRPNAASEIKSLQDPGVKKVVLAAGNLGRWDSSLLLFALDVRAIAHAREITCDLEGFSPTVAAWLETARPDPNAEADAEAEPYDFPITRTVGLTTQSAWARGLDMLHFLGESTLGLGRMLLGHGTFDWSEAIVQMRRCGAQALGIVGLISFLVGVILAFVAATQLRQFGADIFVANLVGLAVFREMGPMMAAIVLAGRTGAAYAAELGNMRLNEEIDALETFGISPFDFLVTPRMVALILMMPLLAIYADLLGVCGGVFIAQSILDVPPVTFFQQLRASIGLNDVGTGLLKSVFFGMIVAYSGCLKGMRAERSAIGVGDATTAAVVLGILLIIVSDASFTVIFDALRW